MVKQKLLKFEIISFIFISLLGVFLHFAYDLSNQNALVGIFSAINESTWEHLKLLFFPTLITIIVGYIFFKNDVPNYLWIKTKGLLLGMIFIIIFFYTTSGIIGSNVAILNIGSFFAAVFLVEYYTLKNIDNKNFKNSNIYALIILVILILCFIIFTFYPPNIGLFDNPIA